MFAMVASSYTPFNHSWYPNSGATNRITPDPNALVNKTTYHGDEQIHVGDGASLQIQHIGSSSFSFPFQF